MQAVNPRPDPDAEDILESIDLCGRRIVLTGGTSGIGRHAAMSLANRGAELVLPVRNIERGLAVVEEINRNGKGGSASVLEADLSSLDSVRAFAQAFHARFDRTDILINNAGVMASPQGTTVDGIETQFAINYLSAFLMTNLLMPAISQGDGPRIINLSSVGHRRTSFDFADPFFEHREYDRWLAYAQSKTAMALFTTALHHRLGGSDIECFSVNPGDSLTNIARNLSQAEIDDFLDHVANANDPDLRMKTVSQAAATVCFAAASPQLAGKGGSYLENCAIAALDDESEWRGVRSYALDRDAADQLWALSEKLVGERFSN